MIDTDGCCWVNGSKKSQYSQVQSSIDEAEVCGNNEVPGHSAGRCERNTNDFLTAFFGYTTPYIYPLM